MTETGNGLPCAGKTVVTLSFSNFFQLSLTIPMSSATRPIEHLANGKICDGPSSSSLPGKPK
jgi:hypothetical protein